MTIYVYQCHRCQMDSRITADDPPGWCPLCGTYQAYPDLEIESSILEEKLKQITFDVYKVETLIELVRQFDVVEIKNKIGDAECWAVTLSVEKTDP